LRRSQLNFREVLKKILDDDKEEEEKKVKSHSSSPKKSPLKLERKKVLRFIRSLK